MASYSEIAGLLSVNDDSGLRYKVTIAAFIRADAVRQEVDDGTAEVRTRKRFAQRILNEKPNPSFISRNDGGIAGTIIEAIYRSVLIANRNATLAQITGASDTAIQGAVDTAFDFLAANFPDPTA